MTKKAPTDRDLALAERAARKGIPTLLKGVMYRSRLEAKWGDFLDRLRWRPQYEPTDLDWYIPDFILNLPAGPVLLEVKPDVQLDVLRVYADKILRSGWLGEFLIVGSALHPSAFGPEYGPVLGLIGERESNGEATLSAAQTFFCMNCQETSVLAAEGSWRCRSCGEDGGNAHVAEGSKSILGEIWALAGSDTQWKPKGWPA